MKKWSRYYYTVGCSRRRTFFSRHAFYYYSLPPTLGSSTISRTCSASVRLSSSRDRSVSLTPSSARPDRLWFTTYYEVDPLPSSPPLNFHLQRDHLIWSSSTSRFYLLTAPLSSAPDKSDEIRVAHVKNRNNKNCFSDEYRRQSKCYQKRCAFIARRRKPDTSTPKRDKFAAKKHVKYHMEVNIRIMQTNEKKKIE